MGDPSARLAQLTERLGVEGLCFDGRACSDVDLSGAALRGSSWRGALLNDVDLTGADLTGADLTGATLVNVQLSGADLSGARLVGATLAQARADGTRWDNANLNRALIYQVHPSDPLDALSNSPPPPIQSAHLGIDDYDAQLRIVLGLGAVTGRLELLGEGDLDDAGVREAEAALVALTEEAPRWFRPWWTLGDLWRRAGDPDTAAWAYEQALQRRPGDLYSGLRASQIHQERDRPEGALRLLQRLKAHAALTARQRRLIARHEARAYLLSGDLANARRCAEDATAESPEDADLNLLTAEIAYHQGDTSAALAFLRRASQLAPERLDIRRALAELCLSALGLPFEAFQLLAPEHGQLEDASPVALTLRALTARQLADQRVGRAIAHPAPEADAPWADAWALERVGAASHALDALDAPPRSAGARGVQVRALMALGRDDEARTLLHAFMEPIPGPDDPLGAAAAEALTLDACLSGAVATRARLGEAPPAGSPSWMARWLDASSQLGAGVRAHLPPSDQAPTPLHARVAHLLQALLQARPRALEPFGLGRTFALRYVGLSELGGLDAVLVDDQAAAIVLHLFGHATQRDRHDAAAPWLVGLAERGLAFAPIVDDGGAPVTVAQRSRRVRLILRASRFALSPNPCPWSDLTPAATDTAAALPTLQALVARVRASLRNVVPFDPSWHRLKHWAWALHRRLPEGLELSGSDASAEVVWGFAPRFAPPFSALPLGAPAVLARAPASWAAFATMALATTGTAYHAITGRAFWPPAWEAPARQALSDLALPIDQALAVVGLLHVAQALETVALIEAAGPTLGPLTPTLVRSALDAAALTLETLARGDLCARLTADA